METLGKWGEQRRGCCGDLTIKQSKHSILNESKSTETVTQPAIVVVTQLCLTLCDSMDCSTPGFPVLSVVSSNSHPLSR